MEGLKCDNKFQELFIENSDSEHEFCDDLDICIESKMIMVDDSDNDDAILDDNISDKKPDFNYNLDNMSDSDVE